MTSLVLVEEPAASVRRLTLNRPAELNTMTAELCEALHQQLRETAADRNIRAVILTGAGRGFCAGLDLRGYGKAPVGPDYLSADDNLADSYWAEDFKGRRHIYPPQR